jgi:hypothetical protein
MESDSHNRNPHRWSGAFTYNVWLLHFPTPFFFSPTNQRPLRNAYGGKYKSAQKKVKSSIPFLKARFMKWV